MRRQRVRFPTIVAQIRSARGFVLLDILVSLVITSIILTALFEAVSQSLTATERSSDRYQAALLARSKLAALGITDKLSEGQSEGRFDTVFSWVLTVDKDEALNLDHEGAPVTLYRVRLGVRWQRRSKTFHLAYKTLRLAPRNEASTLAPIDLVFSEAKRRG